MSENSRLFLALWPDDNTRAKLEQLSQSIRSKDALLVPPHNYHVTLVFIGRVNEVTECQIKKRIARISSSTFTITFNRFNYWQRPKVICLTAQNPGQQIMVLAETLNSAIINVGLPTDTRPYTPHITLAKHVSTFDEPVCEPIAWKAKSFCLVESCPESDGVVYKVKDQWAFEKETPVI
jgi:2'-5' RNA ligase